MCFYLVFCLAGLIWALIVLKTHALPSWVLEMDLAIKCGMVAAMGGVLYCLRSVYLNRCVHDRWDKHWEIWYYLRPIASSICGLVAFLFLRAGLVVLDAKQNVGAGEYGYLAFAFIAGLNVDRFVEKIEDIGRSLFGIEKSRNAKNSSGDTKGE